MSSRNPRERRLRAAERPRRSDVAWRVGHAARASWSAAACSLSARSTAAAPTCARAATPTWPRWCAAESRHYDEPRPRVGRRSPTRSTALTEAVDDDRVDRARDEVEELDGPAGLAARPARASRSPSTDAPSDIRRARAADPNRLVVHQQDIQAVVNALWTGGADGVTIQGQRIVTHDRHQVRSATPCSSRACPTPRPTTIAGDRRPGRAARRRSTSTTTSSVYRSDAAEPDIAVGWEVDAEDADRRAGVRRPARPDRTPSRCRPEAERHRPTR